MVSPPPPAPREILHSSDSLSQQLAGAELRQWWCLGPYFHQDGLALCTPCLLVKPKPYVKTSPPPNRTGGFLDIFVPLPSMATLNGSPFSAFLFYLSVYNWTVESGWLNLAAEDCWTQTLYDLNSGN